MTTATTAAAKLQHLIPLIVRSPNEFVDRVRARLEVQADRRRVDSLSYEPKPLADALAQLEALLSVSAREILEEGSFAGIAEHIAASSEGRRGPISSSHNGDRALASIAYYLCRALRPAVVVETGVAHGVTSAFILQALAGNGAGSLWSIDLPPLGPNADEHVGAFVPPALRDGWHLHRGVSRRLLPGVLRAVQAVDVFIHDSLHTYSNMMWEFETVWPVLRPGGVLIADDIDNNAAFSHFSEKVSSSGAIVVREEGKEGSLLGVLRKPL